MKNFEEYYGVKDENSDLKIVVNPAKRMRNVQRAAYNSHNIMKIAEETDLTGAKSD